MANETLEILKLLISNKEEKFSIRKISMLRKINYKSAYINLKSLGKQGIVDLQKIGNTILCTFNNNFNDLVFKAEYSRKQDLFKHKDFLIINNSLSELRFSFIALLFGSHAKGNASDKSDIDLMIISEKENEKAIENLLSTFSLNIHLIFFSYEEFLQMKNSKEPSVVSEALKNNIILINIEDYYRLLKC